MLIRFHEIMNGEVILPIEETCPATDDLLELDDRVDRPHQHDVAHVARIDAGRELLRRRENRGDRLVVVLEFPQLLITERAIVGRDAHAVVGVFAFLHAVDVVIK
ncbi:MAG: hypothetical protein RIQ56_342 [Candidatus Parcubacteria bacterium]